MRKRLGLRWSIARARPEGCAGRFGWAWTIIVRSTENGWLRCRLAWGKLAVATRASPSAVLLGIGAFTNMRFIKIVGLALLASLAVGMIASASASAELGVFECVAGSGTSNLGANCLTSVGGTFTVKNITGATFTGKAGTTALKSGSNEIKCTSATDEGVITSPTADRATIKFNGCTASSNNCSTSNATTSKEILIGVSSKVVSYTENSVLKAGLLLEPRTGNENKIEIECGAVKDKVYGSVIGAIEPEDTSAKTATVKFVVTSGVQAIAESTNSLRAKFGSGATEKATQESTEGLLDFTLNVEVMG